MHRYYCRDQSALEHIFSYFENIDRIKLKKLGGIQSFKRLIREPIGALENDFYTSIINTIRFEDFFARMCRPFFDKKSRFSVRSRSERLSILMIKPFFLSVTFLSLISGLSYASEGKLHTKARNELQKHMPSGLYRGRLGVVVDAPGSETRTQSCYVEISYPGQSQAGADQAINITVKEELAFWAQFNFDIFASLSNPFTSIKETEFYSDFRMDDGSWIELMYGSQGSISKFVISKGGKKFFCVNPQLIRK